MGRVRASSAQAQCGVTHTTWRGCPRLNHRPFTIPGGVATGIRHQTLIAACIKVIGQFAFRDDSPGRHPALHRERGSR